MRVMRTPIPCVSSHRWTNRVIADSTTNCRCAGRRGDWKREPDLGPDECLPAPLVASHLSQSRSQRVMLGCGRTALCWLVCMRRTLRFALLVCLQPVLRPRTPLVGVNAVSWLLCMASRSSYEVHAEYAHAKPVPNPQRWMAQPPGPRVPLRNAPWIDAATETQLLQ